MVYISISWLCFRDMFQHFIDAFSKLNLKTFPLVPHDIISLSILRASGNTPPEESDN